MSKILFSLLLIFFIDVSLFGQDNYTSSDKKAIELFEESMKHYRMNRLNEVEKLLKQALERDEKFIEARLELGILYGEQNRHTEAVNELEMVLQIDPNSFPETEYYLGLFYLNMGNYQKARATLNSFIEVDAGSQKQRENAHMMLKKCEFALANKEEVIEFNPINLGPEINSEFREYYPCLTADDNTLLYTRQIPSSRTTDGLNEDFYIAGKMSGKWTPSKNLGAPINTLNNEGAPTLSVDGQLLIFTACELYGDYGPQRKGFGSCDLFFSQKIGERWGAPRNLGGTVNTRHWETQPSFSSDGRTLYFIRGINTHQGMKEQDIFTTFLTDSGWTEPVKLPPVINSPGREESVHIHPDGKTLYFASDGHPGYGGFDLFVSRLDSSGSWSEPQNLGYPINSPGDENSLLVNASGEIGYFASDRPGGYGMLDLYSFEMPESRKPEKVTFMKGKVYDELTKKPLQARFELIDLKTGEIVIESYSNGSSGEFLVCLPPNRDYALNCSKDKYLFYSDHFTLTAPESSDQPYYKDVPLIPIRKGARTVLNNIFFETNKYNLKEKSKIELGKLIDFLNANMNVTIEIGGHTDNTGTKAINEVLSENRAKAVYQYLIEHGIGAERLSFKGYADNEPVATNETIAGRAKNRRTEFKITAVQP